jgi:hypothetical protein
MAAGEGGSPGQPTGRPGDQQGDNGDQFGSPPPSYPSAPTGPPAYPPAPGYAPAPPASWEGPTPKPLERPVTVRAGIGAFMASLILSLISGIVVFTDTDSLVNQVLAQVHDPALTASTVRAGLLVGVIIGLVFAGLEAMFIWFAWNGRNWARIVLWVLGGLSIVSGLANLFSGSMQTSGFLAALGFVQFLLAVVGVVFLALKPSNDWYRYRGWLRATGQRR